MRLIAKKPCSFGGRKFFIGDDIPVYFVADPEVQEKLGVLAIVEDESENVPQVVVSGHGKMYSYEEVNAMIADAVAEAERKHEAQLAELQEHAAEWQEVEQGAFEDVIPVTVFGEENDLVIRVSPEEIDQVFSVMQLNAEEGAKQIAGVKSENVLILLHAADSRKTIKNAAKEQVDKLYSSKGVPEENRGNHEAADVKTEGS